MFFSSRNLLWIHMFKCFKLLFLSLVVYLLTSLPRIYTTLLVAFLLHPSILPTAWVVCKTGFFPPFNRWKKMGKGEHHPYETCMFWALGGPVSRWVSVRFKVTKRGSNGLGHRTFNDEIQVSYLYLPNKKNSIHKMNRIIVVLVGGFSNDMGQFASSINEKLIDHWNTSKEWSYSVNICCCKSKYHIKFMFKSCQLWGSYQKIIPKQTKGPFFLVDFHEIYNYPLCMGIHMPLVKCTK